jgi:tetratricopeptide (TPR) repeat protein
MKTSPRRKRTAAAPKAAPASREPPKAWPLRVAGIRAWAVSAGLLVLGLLIYAPSLSGPFVLDDFDLMEVFSAVRLGDLSGLYGTGRPLLMLSYVLNHRLAGGFHPFGFHLTNVLLHGLNAILLWRFLAALFGPGRPAKQLPEGLSTLLIYGVPLLFLTSPIQTESVAYISSRSEIFSVTFYLLALWVFASPLRESRPWATALLVIVLAGAAALTKQDKVTLPFAILLLDYLLLADTDWRQLKKNLPTYGLFAAGLVAAFFVVIRPSLFAFSAGFGLDWKTYFLTQFRMVFLYLKLLLVPLGLNLDRDITPSHTLGEHLAWLALLGLIVLLGAVLRYHRRYPIGAFGATLFFVTLAPCFYPRLDFAAERWIYLPSIGFYMVLVVVLHRLAGAPRPAAAVVAGLAVAFSIGTYQRSKVWSNDLLLWRDTAEKSPQKARPWTWLGRVYIERGQYALALQALEKGEQAAEPRSPEQAHVLNNIGLAYANLKQYSEAIAAYRRAIEILPDEPLFHAHLAVALIHSGRKEEGWQAFGKAFEQRGPYENLEPYLLRGQEHFQEGRYREAAEDFRTALRLRPDDAKASRNLAAAEEMMRRRGEQ